MNFFFFFIFFSIVFVQFVVQWARVTIVFGRLTQTEAFKAARRKREFCSSLCLGLDLVVAAVLGRKCLYISLSLCMSVCACVCAQLYCDPRQRHNDNSNNNKTAAAIASSEPREKFTCQCAAGRCIVRTDFSFRVLRYLISNSTIFGWFSNLNFFFRWHVRYNSAWTNISQRYRTKQQKFDFALLHLRFSQSNLS